MIEPTVRIMMLDTETTNDIDFPFCYDVGYRVFDLAGNIYEEASFVNADVFLDKELMASAYYAEKIPQYWMDIWAKRRQLLTWKIIKGKIYEALLRYDVKIISAHNARFDYRSLHLTQRYITTSRWRWVLPFGQAEWWDTLKMCREIFKEDKDYKEWCEQHGLVTSYGTPRMTAEAVYGYIIQDANFIEAHTGLEDVKIEMEIFKYCLKRNPEIDGRLWKPPDGG